MIVFNLNCSDCASSFEGWFENTKDYNKQIRSGLLTCPSCNSTQIKKGLMAIKPFLICVLLQEGQVSKPLLICLL